MNERGDIEWALWAGTIGFETSLVDRLAAAVAGGYRYASLGPPDVQRAADEGMTARELARRADDSGVRWVMDPIMNWHPTLRPSGLPHAQFDVDEVLRMCADLRVASVSPIASSTTNADPDEMAAHFAALGDAAAEMGMGVHLEFMPMSAVPDLEAAWRIVRLADRPNCGLMFDTWHFFRSTPDFDLLATIPGERILAVQVSDARAEIRGKLWADTMNRVLPGDGSFDLRRVLGLLTDIDGVRCLGPEVISPDLAIRDPGEVAMLARERVAQLLP
jgi:sugar phosphate isomerase/epimerase